LRAKVLRGISARKYEETLLEEAKTFGVSLGEVSRRVVELMLRRLKVPALLERR
jgi:hypothetical protein